MKITTVNGVLTAQAETKEDIKNLLGLEKGVKVTTSSTRKYKKQVKKTCNICGVECKGAVGLGIHRARKHGIKSTQTTGTPSPIGASSAVPA